MSEVYVSVDIECDGKVPGMFSMLSLGACVVGKPDESYYAELRPVTNAFDAEALAVSGLDRERLKREGEHPNAAMPRFVQWVESLNGRPVFCSFSSWDWVFVYYYLIHYAGRSPFSHSSLDAKSLYMGRFGGEWRDTSKRRISSRHPALTRDLPRHSHNALEDAREQAELLRRILLTKPLV